ncbi:MAG TPA: hypothetical protein VNJ08_09860 [Bacteriovoracaceae bacterium]|nr:hypothetical protein [Bacteriovoracaceae bacterium]
MSVLDLKPTCDETIEKLGLSAHDLWNVKIGEEVFGPFESESLKHYAGENQDVFEDAFACLQEGRDWQPFFSYPIFQRRGPQVMKDQPPKEGPYWVLDHGQKAGPFNQHDMDKRIELGSIGLTELISTDDGHTWVKLYQVEGFDRRFHSSSELPFSPLESNFQKARLELIEKIESQSGLIRTSEELAELAHSSEVIGKVLAFKAEDVPLRPAEDTMISSNLKWQIPVAVAVMFMLVAGVRVIVTSSAGSKKMAKVEKNNTESQKINYAHVPGGPAGRPRIMPDGPGNHPGRPFTPPQPNQYAHESQYPTQIVTHQNDFPQENHEQPQEHEREPASIEHSLVGTPDEPQTLDSAMGNPQPVEEVSDF